MSPSQIELNFIIKTTIQGVVLSIQRHSIEIATPRLNQRVVITPLPNTITGCRISKSILFVLNLRPKRRHVIKMWDEIRRLLHDAGMKKDSYVVNRLTMG